ncbi:hypothetical protein AQEC111735_12055 [Aquirufa ecclesiirivi]
MTLNLSSDADELTVPSVTETSADSALYKIIEAVPTPLVKVTTVLLPKLMAVAFLLVTVGAVTGFVELVAPEKVKVLSPEYPVTVLPSASLAVKVMVCAAPAVCEPEPVMTNLATVPALMVTFELVTAVPDAGVNVNVPVPAFPVKIKPEMDDTPLVKSLTLFNLLVPVKPVIVPVKVVVTVMLLVAALKPVATLPQKS